MYKQQEYSPALMALIHSIRCASPPAIMYNVLKSSVLYTTYNSAVYTLHPTNFLFLIHCVTHSLTHLLKPHYNFDNFQLKLKCFIVNVIQHLLKHSDSIMMASAIPDLLATFLVAGNATAPFQHSLPVLLKVD